MYSHCGNSSIKIAKNISLKRFQLKLKVNQHYHFAEFRMQPENQPRMIELVSANFHRSLTELA